MPAVLRSFTGLPRFLSAAVLALALLRAGPALAQCGDGDALSYY